ncbi:hypothetical protein FIBSPDRAFT_759647, partial [Athelia psychrophila]
KVLMDTLILKFEGTNTGPHAFLAFKAMVDTKWDGKDDISNVISCIRTYQQNLTALSFPLDNTILVFVLLYTLPDTPKNTQLWSMITSSVPKNEKLTFAHVESHFTTNTLICAAGKLISALLTASKKKGKGKVRGEAHSTQEDVSESKSEGEMAASAMYTQAHVSAKSKRDISAYILSEPSPTVKLKLLLDSGVSSGMVPHIEWFKPSSLRPLDPPCPIGFGDDSEVFAVAIGTIVLTTKTTNVRPTNVLLVPNFVIKSQKIMKKIVKTVKFLIRAQNHQNVVRSTAFELSWQ